MRSPRRRALAVLTQKLCQCLNDPVGPHLPVLGHAGGSLVPTTEVSGSHQPPDSSIPLVSLLSTPEVFPKFVQPDSS